MSPNLYIIYDESGIQGNDRGFLALMGLATAGRAGNIGCYIGIKGGTGEVPTLYFDNPMDERIFFNKIQAQPSLIAFTTAPNDVLDEFHGKFFQDSQNVFKIKCLREAHKEEQQSTFSRWLVFKKEVQRPGDVFINTKLINEISAEQKSNPLIYKTYISPVEINISDDNIFPFYASLFQNRKQLPLILPPIRAKEPNSYFGNYNIDGKIVSIPLVRNKFKENLLSNEHCKKDTLFVELWNMADNPSLTEFLADGCYLKFESTTLEKDNNGLIVDSQEAMGYPLVSFVYPSQDKNEKETLVRWKSDLLEPQPSSSHPGDAIKKAILTDITESLPGFNGQITKSKKNLVKNWDIIDAGAFNEFKGRGPTGNWTEIDSIKNGLIAEEDAEVKNFVDKVILQRSAKQGRHNPDHDLAAVLFSDYLCKFPFEAVPNYKDNWYDYEKADFKTEWVLFFLEFVKKKGNISPLDIDSTLKIENKICTYSSPLTQEQIFRLRLSLPSNVKLECTFSSVLDFPNALDSNFIL